MASYAIGDIHGCFETFIALLEEIEFDAAEDEILHTGDMVNGGPKSLETIRWFIKHDSVVTSVLGNHDLHLLAVACGEGELRDNDTFIDILEASDREELLDWLRGCPMIVELGDQVLVHAGLLPDWTVADAKEAARAVEEQLRSSDWTGVFENMYGNEPRLWRDAKSGEDRRRLTINAMTRMRAVRKDRGELEFMYKGTYEEMPEGLCAWFDVEDRAWAGHQVICGHWSALGLRQWEQVLALDTGCRWGRKLTACRLEDGQICDVDARENR